MNELWVADGLEESLDKMGLQSVEDGWSENLGGELVNDRGDRQVLRIRTESGGVTYLKRWRFAEGSLSPFFPGQSDLRNRAKKEFDNLRELERLGIRAPKPLAFGERRGVWGPVASILLLEDLEGYACCVDRLEEGTLASSRIAAGVGGLLRRLHAANLYYRSPGLKHFYARDSGEEGNWAVIDVPRLDRLPLSFSQSLKSPFGGEVPGPERDLSKTLIGMGDDLGLDAEGFETFWRGYLGDRFETEEGSNLIRRVEEKIAKKRKDRARRRIRKEARSAPSPSGRGGE